MKLSIQLLVIALGFANIGYAMHGVPFPVLQSNDLPLVKTIGLTSAGMGCALGALVLFKCSHGCWRIAKEGFKLTKGSMQVTGDILNSKPNTEAQVGVQLGAGLAAGFFSCVCAIGSIGVKGTSILLGSLGLLSSYGSYKFLYAARNAYGMC